MRREDSHYEGQAGEKYQHAVHGDVIESRELFQTKAQLAAYRYFTNCPPDARILEFGVGVGTNLAALPNSTRHGYDIGEFARLASKQAGLTVFDTIEDIPRESYDIVLCRHVLEHVHDPKGTLQLLRTFLAENGLLLLIIPVERTNRTAFRLPQPDVNNHLFAWGPQHLTNLLHEVDLVPIDHRYYWYSMQDKLKPVVSLLGVEVYSALVSIAGRLRRQRELAVWAKVR